MPEKQDQSLIKLVMGRQTKLQKDRVNFEQRMQDVADYVCPHRDDIRGTLVKGEQKGRKIYDSTAVSAAVLAADGIHGYHVSPAFPWFMHMMNRKSANKIPEIREWLQETDYNMYMALTRSNFYSEMWSYIYDGFTVGTASIFPEEDMAEDRIVFESIHPGEGYIAENRYGEVDVYHRKRKRSARQLVQKFGLENVTDSIRQAYENHPFQEFEIIHAVFPREEFDSRKKDGKNKRYASVWLLTAGNHLLSVGGFDRFPYQVWRYLKTGKEAYGVSPAVLAMPDILGLNLMNKTILGAAQLAVDPAYNIPEYLEGKVELKPRGRNYLRQGDAITPVSQGANFPIGVDREQAKQQAIKERFHVDTFLMLSSLAGRGQRTATEVIEMMGEKAAVLGAELGPLNTRLDGLLDQVYDIEMAAGRMPQPPDILQEMADQDPGLRFDPVYMGPLAQAQREKFAKEGISKLFMDMAPLIEAQGATGSIEVLDNLDFDETFLTLADRPGVPQNIIRAMEKRDAIRSGRAEAAETAATQQAMTGAAAMTKDAAAADKDMNGQLLPMIVGGGLNVPA